MIISWFSCGAASASATKISIRDNDDEHRIIYQAIDSEHPDNLRFLHDCEDWLSHPIEIHKHPVFKTHWDVIEKRRYISGVAGAPCTGELKRKPAEEIVFGYDKQPLEVFGYTVEEQARADRFRGINNERKMLTPLIDAGFTKQDCYGFVEKAGIALPEIYKHFDNANCIGCAKASNMPYWRSVREYYPEQFDRMARLERKLNAAVNKRYVAGERIRVFLDELPDGPLGRGADVQCGIICQMESE